MEIARILNMTTDNRPLLRCLTVCLAQSFQFATLRERLLDSGRTQVFRNAVVIDYKTGCAIVFGYGVVVYWNVSLDDRYALQQILLDYAVKADAEPPAVVVTILCDGGAKYASRLYNLAWLAEKGLIDAAVRGGLRV